MKQKLYVAVLGTSLVGLMSLISACSGSAAAAEVTTTGPATSISISSPVSYFPVQKDGYESLAYPAALTSGTLALEDGYLVLRYSALPSTEKGMIVVWPPGSTLKVEGDSVQVLNRQGQCIAAVGESLNVGGGQVPGSIVLNYTGVSVPSGCSGPYWLAAPGVYNAPRPNSPGNGLSPELNAALDEAAKKGPEYMEATLYADHSHISVEEALAILRIQRSFPSGMLEEKLVSQESATYAGLWFQNDPEFKIVVAFTRDGEATFKKYYSTDLDPYLPYLEVRTVKFTSSELSQKRQEITSKLRALGIPNDSATYIQYNNVEVRVSESMRAQIEEAVQTDKLVIPEGVQITYGSLAQPV